MRQNQNTSCLCRMGEEHAEKHGHEITIMQDWEKYKKFVKKFKKQSET